MSISEATRSLVVDRSAPGVFTKTGFGAVSAPAVRREAEVLTSMRHPRVPAVIDVIDDGDRVRLDVVDAGRFDLSHRVIGDASTAVRIAAGLLSAVAEIHELGWAHGSLAAEHVVVGSKFNVTLCSWSRAIDLAATAGEARDRAERADFAAVIDIVDTVIDQGAESSRRDRRVARRARRVIDRLAARLDPDPDADRGADPAVLVRKAAGELAALTRQAERRSRRPAGRASRTTARMRSRSLSARRRARRTGRASRRDRTGRARRPAASLGLSAPVGAATIPPAEVAQPATGHQVATGRQVAAGQQVGAVQEWSPLRSAGRATGLAAVFFAALWGLRRLGGTLFAPDALGDRFVLDGVPSSVAFALGVLHVAAMIAAAYGLMISLFAAAAIVTRVDWLRVLTVRLTPRPVRGAVAALVGLGLVAGAVVHTAAASPSDHVSQHAASVGRATSQHVDPGAPIGTHGGAMAVDVRPDRLDPFGPTDPGSQVGDDNIVGVDAAANNTAPTDTVEASPDPDALPASASAPATWTIQRGDHLWGVAEATLARHLARSPTDAEITPYWSRLIETNRHRLIDPTNPDLVIAGQTFELPPIT